MELSMPPMGSEARSEVLGNLGKQVHEKQTNPAYLELLRRLWDDRENLEPHDQRLVELQLEACEQARKLPVYLVEACAQLWSENCERWKEARNGLGFEHFRPNLEKAVKLTREYAQCLQKPGQPLYDVLLDDYDRGMTIEKLTQVFSRLREFLVPFSEQAAYESRLNPARPLITVSKSERMSMYRDVVSLLGFDLSSGRINEVTHPFMSCIHEGDIRLTTRHIDDDILDSLYGIIHETGHGLVELGRPWELGPISEVSSSAIHESQSRFYEVFIGQSREFTELLHNLLLRRLGRAAPSPKHIYASMNAVKKTPIRLEADEVTYGLHIILRFELEKLLLDGALEVRDLDDAWNQKTREYLGVKVKGLKEGVLQDSHWPAGNFGYFPSYGEGNCYGAQFLRAMEKDLGSIGTVVASGDLHPIRDWLRAKIHSKGGLLDPEDLCREVTGEGLNPEPFIEYLRNKYTV
jgi:carboxypeptidase Taq